MSRKSSIPQSRRHLMIYNEDWDYLGQCYGPDSVSPAGVGKAIKTLVHAFVTKMKQQEQHLMAQKMDLKSEDKMMLDLGADV